MKLVTRVSAFFLAATVAVLILYSALFYFIVRRQLTEQWQTALQTDLHALVAAVEVEPEEVKWQPSEHAIGLASQRDEEVQWVVIGDGRTVVETSRSASGEFVSEAIRLGDSATALVRHAESPQFPDWVFLQQRLSAPAPMRIERELDEFDEIVITVARSRQRLESNLRRLGLLVCALPCIAGLAAAGIGRWFVRRALRPVAAMAHHASKTEGGDFAMRLPVEESGDELAELGRSFNSLLDRQQQSFNAQRRFAGDAAHELRTPLTVLLGQLDVALRRPRTVDEYRETLATLRSEAAELQQIVESLLFLARSERDATLPDAQWIELAEWGSTYIQRWDEHDRRDDLHFEGGPSASVNGSPALLSRLLDNLVLNALKYSPAGTPVAIGWRRLDDEATLFVRDQGIGIAREDLSSIFEPFFRAPAARGSGVGGVGLGLAIASRIAATFGGRLDCSSELGKGSEFSAALPCR